MKTIALCMIVKDEAHIIRRCLAHARRLVDYVLIVDTGSRDGTPQVIQDFLQEQGLPGEVIVEPWRDFAYNRSFALEKLRAQPSVDYGLMLDADNILHYADDFDANAFKAALCHDLYDVPLVHGSVSYYLPSLFSNHRPFAYRGVLHEFLDCQSAASRGTACGFSVEQIQDSARNRNPLKYQDDARVLEQALTVERDPFLISRYTFYLAQSYRDAGLKQQALARYQERARLGYWDQEIFMSLYQAAHLMKELGYSDEDVLLAYRTAQQACPSRVEAVHGAARLCREKGYYQRGYELAQACLHLAPPTHSLFREDWIYDYGLLDEYAVNAYWSGHYQDCYDACQRILTHRNPLQADRNRILQNAQFAWQKLQATGRFAIPAPPSNTSAAATDLRDLLALERLPHIVDIGANPVDGDPPYQAMLRAGLCHVTGFEPQEQALRELQVRQGPNERYLPYAVGDGQAHILNICQASGMTSCLEPDPAALELFSAFKTHGRIIERVSVQTRKLDEISEIEHLDFLKIDIQGGEWAVFRNGVQKMASAVVVQVEVSFVNLYKNQPSLGEIDLELRRQGFIPHCFAAIKCWPLSPGDSCDTPLSPSKQLLEADMVYVRDFSNPETLSDEQLKQLAMIAHYCYGSTDLALHCVMLLEQRAAIAPGAQDEYRQRLANTASPQHPAF